MHRGKQKTFTISMAKIISVNNAKFCLRKQCKCFVNTSSESWFCFRCSVFRGREDVLESVRKYLVHGKSNQPLVIYGESGCGKTSVLSKVASLSHTWLSGVRPVVILRYLGIYLVNFSNKNQNLITFHCVPNRRNVQCLLAYFLCSFIYTETGMGSDPSPEGFSYGYSYMMSKVHTGPKWGQIPVPNWLL